MLREKYELPDELMRFKENTLELSNELDEIIQQVDLLLFTRKGDVLCMPEFGCDLEMYLFETEYNEVAIKQIIWQQINTFIYLDGTYTVDINVEFVEWDFNVAMVVDLLINNKKVSSYLI